MSLSTLLVPTSHAALNSSLLQMISSSLETDLDNNWYPNGPFLLNLPLPACYSSLFHNIFLGMRVLSVFILASLCSALHPSPRKDTISQRFIAKFPEAIIVYGFVRLLWFWVYFILFYYGVSFIIFFMFGSRENMQVKERQGK